MEKELNKLQEEQLDDVSGGIRFAEAEGKNTIGKQIIGKAGEGRIAHSKDPAKAKVPSIKKLGQPAETIIDLNTPSKKYKIE